MTLKQITIILFLLISKLALVQDSLEFVQFDFSDDCNFVLNVPKEIEDLELEIKKDLNLSDSSLLIVGIYLTITKENYRVDFLYVQEEKDNSRNEVCLPLKKSLKVKLIKLIRKINIEGIKCIGDGDEFSYLIPIIISPD